MRLFGFGADTGIDLPFEFDGRVADQRAEGGAASTGRDQRGRRPDLQPGDIVQLAIGQGLLAASPLQLAVGYSTIANCGFVMKPEIVMAIYEPERRTPRRPASPT